MDGKIHVASIENLARLEAILGDFAEKTSETLDSFGRRVERRLEGLEEYCEQLEREAEYWDDRYETADDDEDDIGYLAYKRDEAQEKLARARRTQHRVNESAENFARAARRVSAISSERLAEARAFLEHKIEELNEYTAFQLNGGGSGLAVIEASAAPAAVSTSPPATNFINRFKSEVEQLKRLNAALKNIPMEDLAAIKAYTGNKDYEILNLALRNNDAAAVRQHDEQIKHTIAGLNQLPAYRGTVFRGSSNLPEEVFKSYREHGYIIEKGFSSSSTDSRVGRSFTHDSDIPNPSGMRAYYIIHSQTGRDVSQVQINPYECEVIFPPDTKFKVIKILRDSDDGIPVIFMSEVTDE
jgi:hypothetical protein